MEQPSVRAPSWHSSSFLSHSIFFLLFFSSQIDRPGINKSPSQIALTDRREMSSSTPSIFFLFSFDLPAAPSYIPSTAPAPSPRDRLEK